MSQKFLKGFLVRSGEAALAIVAVLCFFLSFWSILSLSFPEGATLTDLLNSNESGEALSGYSRESGGGRSIKQELGAESIIASLVRVNRDVKERPGDAIAWREAHAGAELANRHAIQTLDRSSATIAFTSGSEMSLAENSLVILKKWEQYSGTRRKRASLIVLGGQLKAKLFVADDAEMTVEIIAATDSARIRAEAGKGEQTEFVVKVNEDGSSTFSVFSGTGEVTTDDKTIVIDENHSVTVTSSGESGPMVELPPSPTLTQPQDGFISYYRTIPQRVRFGWSSEPEVDQYRLLIARDVAFQDIVHDVQLEQTEFIHGNLRAGSYFWRVSAQRGPLEGASSSPAQMVAVQDRRPPALRVSFPDQVVQANHMILSGSTEPGSTVYVGDVTIPVLASGQFNHSVKLRRGLNEVVVEAIDIAGNVSYESKFVHAQY